MFRISVNDLSVTGLHIYLSTIPMLDLCVLTTKFFQNVFHENVNVCKDYQHCLDWVDDNSILSYYYKQESIMFKRVWRIHLKSIYLIEIKVVASTYSKLKLILTFTYSHVKLKFGFLPRNALPLWSVTFSRTLWFINWIDYLIETIFNEFESNCVRLWIMIIDLIVGFVHSFMLTFKKTNFKKSTQDLI